MYPYRLISLEEFVAAGDFLSYKFPTWSWSAASSSDAKYTRDFLPADKQYLISRGVPSLRRVRQMEKAALGTVGDKSDSQAADERLLNFGEGHDGEEVHGKGNEEDWLATHLDGEWTMKWRERQRKLILNNDEEESHPSAVTGDIEDIPDSEPPQAASSLTAGEEDDLASRVAGATLHGPHTTTSDTAHARSEGGNADIGEIPDMDDEDDELGGLGEGVIEADDPATASLSSQIAAVSAQGGGRSSNKLLSVRTYDCLITYDKYYQTPRMWLVGYNEAGQPLKPAEIFEDVSSDYAQKTVTVEPFPHGNLSTASIHPCKHASVMKKVIERMNATVIEEQRKARASGTGGTPGTAAAETKKKKGWGLGGAMKKIAGKESAGDGSQTPSSAGGEGTEAEEAQEVEGLRVDQYLLIFLKFMASIVPAIEIDATQAV